MCVADIPHKDQLVLPLAALPQFQALLGLFLLGLIQGKIAARIQFSLSIDILVLLTNEIF
jgi:hypothetical protein